MSHAHHESLEGFDARQILHDGCDECEYRGERPALALASLDMQTVERAWKRAFDHFASRGGGHEATGTLAQCERPLLETLWAFQVILERRGIPIGRLP